MNELITAVPIGITAFIATNLDDILILLLFFSQANANFRHRHIISGQYLGFATLVLLSLPGFFGGLMFPQDWVGLLGIAPISIGLSRFLTPDSDQPEAEPISGQSAFSTLLSPQTCSIAAVTFANGGDNVGIYVPLFANCTWDSLLIVLSVFFSMVGVWCYAAYQLTRLPAIAETLSRYGNLLVPFVLIGLGILILIDSHTLENRGLVVLTLVLTSLWTLKLIAALNLTPQVEKY
ncbi:MAG: cadmium resistance transporter [Plectolyngbya sp. WJT66-NPBG17]|jgi:cadmium resistance transport/sequestration family protein|nr:cadmium resistance transporter [Plectolyngbya sp. WJT66-NPBG17]MBW4529004.1 cadmium resistance transporter [Phormidium tanganyikae FI6-MK23]